MATPAFHYQDPFPLGKDTTTYRNIGTENGIVFNAPNRLFAGQGKGEPVDEIRHEELVDSPYLLD